MLGADKEYICDPVNISTPKKGEVVLSELTISGTYQTEFYVGETFNYEGLEITAHYSDGSQRNLEYSEVTISTPDMSSVGDKDVEITYTEGEITLTTSYLINVIDKVVSSIELSGEYLTSFYTGDEFSYEGLIVTANYEDGTSRELTDDEYSVSEPDLSAAGSQTVTVSYNENINATYTIEVMKNTIFSIELSGDYQYKFYTGDEFSYEGLIVTATYKNGSSKVLEDGSYNVEAPDMSYSGGKYVEVSYTEDGITKRASYEIVVVDGDLTSITLSGDYKIQFSVGEEFDHSGLIVTAHYSDGSSKIRADSELVFDVPDLTYQHTAEVTVSYTELGITKSASYMIDIIDSGVKYIDLSGEYAKTFYTGDEFSYEGLIVTATYGDGSTKELSSDEYSVSEPDLTVTGEQTITVSYSETIFATYKIEVLQNTIISIELSGEYQTEFYVGDDFSYEGLIVTAIYRNDSTKVLEDGTYVVEAPDLTSAGSSKEVTVSYTEGDVTQSATYYIDVISVEPESLTLGGNPKVEFFVGEDFTYDRLTVTVVYNNGDTRQLEENEYSVSDVDTSEAGSQTVTVSARIDNQLLEKEYSIEVIEITPYSLEVTGDYQKEYYVGDQFNPNAMSLILTYNNGDIEEVNEGFEIDEPDLTSSGVKTGTVRYEGLEAEFEVEVFEVSITEIYANPEYEYKTEYIVGEEFDPSDIVIHVVYNNGTETDVRYPDFTYEEPDMSVENDNCIVTLYYDGEPVEIIIVISSDPTQGP